MKVSITVSIEVTEYPKLDKVFEQLRNKLDGYGCKQTKKFLRRNEKNLPDIKCVYDACRDEQPIDFVLEMTINVQIGEKTLQLLLICSDIVFIFEGCSQIVHSIDYQDLKMYNISMTPKVLSKNLFVA